MRKRLVILLVILVVVIGTIIFSYFALSKDNRSSSASSDGISIYRSANMEIDSLSFNFMMAKNPEFVNITYDVRSINQNTTGLVTIDIPFGGILSIPDGWSANKSSTSDSTLIYRLFYCSNKNPCTKDFHGQMAFIFSKNIDEKDGYRHAVQLNIKQSPVDEGISNIIQNIQKSVSYSLLDDFPYTIAIFLDSNSDNPHPLPPPDEQYSSSIFGVNTKVFSWNFKKSVDEFITVDYENPDERTNWTNFETWAIPIGLAIGAAVILDLTKPDLFGSNSNSRQERKEHSRFLNDHVYRRLLDVYIRPQSERKFTFKVPVDLQQSRSDRMFQQMIGNDPPLISVTSLQYFEYAMNHLEHKKYKKILSHWKKANDLLDEYNSLVTSLPATLLTAINREMTSIFPDFIEFRGDGRDNSYLSSNIIERLWRFNEYEHNIQQIDLNSVNFGNNDYRIMSDGLTIIQSPNSQKLDPDKCRQVLVTVYSDENVQTQFKKLDELRKLIGHEIGQFSAELEDIVIKINGGHIIEGKCSLEN